MSDTGPGTSVSYLWGKLRRRLFTLTLQQFKAEELVPLTAVKILLGLHFVLIGLSLVGNKGMFQTISSTRAELTQTWWGGVLVLHLMLYAILILAQLREYQVDEQPDWPVYVSTWCKLVHLYIFTPGVVWLYGYPSVYYFNPEGGDEYSPLMAVFSTSLLLSSLSLSMLFLHLMRNDFPTEGTLSSPRLAVEASVYFVCISLVYLHQLSPLYSHPLAKAIDVAGCTALLAICLMAIYMGVFWSFETNSYYLRWLARVTLLKIYIVVLRYLLPESFMPRFSVPFFLILQDLAARGASSLSYRCVMMRVAMAINRPSSFDLYYTVFSFQLLREKLDHQGDNPVLLTPEEKDLMLVKASYQIKDSSRRSHRQDTARYYSRLENMNPYSMVENTSSKSQGSTSSNAPEDSLEVMDPSEETLSTYLDLLIADQTASPAHLLFILRIMVMTIWKHMAAIPPILHRLKNKLGPKYDSNFNFFHIDSLIRGRMMLMYRSTEMYTQTVRKPLSDIYLELSCGHTAQMTLNIKRVLSHKKTFAEVCLDTQRYIDKKTDLLLYVQEKPIPKSSFLYDTNRSVHFLGSSLDRSYKELVEQQFPTSFTLAATIIYFLKIRFKITEAELHFKTYRNLLMRLQNSSRNLEKITDLNIQLNSVVIKVHLNKDHLGRIVDITPGYREYLGQFRGRDPIGTDLNELFPQAFRREHRKMMSEFKGANVFNKQMKFYINTFDGNLRPVDFYIKLGADIDDDFSSTVALRFANPSDRCLVLLDDQYNIISAEKKFWQVFTELGLPEQPRNMKDIADSVCCNLDLYKFTNRDLKADEIRTETGFLRWKECLTSAYSHLRQARIVHKLNVDLVKDSRMPLDVPIIVNFDFGCFGKVQYTKVWIKFNLAHKEFPMTMASVSRFKTTSNMKVSNVDSANPNTPVASKKVSFPYFKKNDSQEGSQSSSISVESLDTDGRRETEVPFEQILLNLKRQLDIDAFITEGSHRGFNTEVMNSIIWTASYMQDLLTNNCINPKTRKADLESGFIKNIQRNVVQDASPLLLNLPPETITKKPILSISEFELTPFIKSQNASTGALPSTLHADNTLVQYNSIISAVTIPTPQNKSTKTGNKNKESVSPPQGILMKENLKMKNNKGIIGQPLKTVETVQSRHYQKEQLNHSENEILIASMNTNVTTLLSHIESYKLGRRDLNKIEDVESIQSSHTSSSLAIMLKATNQLVNSGKQTRYLYSLIAGLLLGTIYFVILFNVISVQLAGYNKSNLTNFKIIQNFMRMDRELIEATESLSTYNQLVRAYTNTTELTLMEKAFTPLLGTYTATTFLEKRLNYSINELQDIVKNIIAVTISSIDQNNAIDIKDVFFQPKRFRYDNRMLEGEIEIIDVLVPYYVLINYYIDSFNRGRADLNIVSQIYDSNPTGFVLTPDLEDLLLFLKIALYDQFRSFYADTLPVMRSTFEDIANRLVLKDVERHLDSIWVKIYFSIGISIGYLFYLSYIYYRTSKKLQDLLNIYVLLRVWEIHSMVDGLVEDRETFSRYWLNELHSMEQYLNFFTSSYTNDNLDKMYRLQKHYKRDKLRTRIHHNFLFRSAKQLICIGLVTLLIFVMSITVVFIFNEVNKKRMGLQALTFKTHALLTDVNGSYLSILQLQIRGQKLLIGGVSPMDDPFPQAAQRFIKHITGHKQQIDGYLGEKHSLVIQDLFYGDLCSYISDTPDLQQKNFDLEGVCREGLRGATEKGLLGFIQAQEHYLGILKARILSQEQEFLNATRYSSQPSLTGYLYEPANLEQRVVNWVVYKVFYHVWLSLSDQRVTQLQEDMEFYVSGIIYYFALLMSVVVPLEFFFAVRAVQRDLVVGYEVFNILDPFYMVNNKLLYNQLHASYTGIS